MSRPIIPCRSRFPLPLCAFALACLAGTAVNAQESIRPSGISSLAADARQEQASKLRGQFMQVGPVKVDASAQIEFEMNDNVGTQFDPDIVCALLRVIEAS